MSLQSVVTVEVIISGDQQWQLELATAQNASSPAQNDIRTLANGANTITPPTGGTSPQGVIIIPPAANTTAITLKGISGDTGIGLHLTNPTFISLASPTATFVITTGAQIAGVRFVWT